MIRILIVNSLVVALLGCPYFCFAEAAGSVATSRAVSSCQAVSKGGCSDHCGQQASQETHPGDFPDQPLDCPDPNCICEGAVVTLVDDGVGLDVRPAAMPWFGIVPFVVATQIRPLPLVADLTPFRHLDVDSQRRCALMGTFLL